jgi:signal transduction histidine kinase
VAVPQTPAAHTLAHSQAAAGIAWQPLAVINAISLAHDQLAPHEKGQIVKLSDYLRALCLSIKQQTEGIEVEMQADELELSIERAVPLGLILNEIATNSIKHAFGPDGGGRITVKLIAGVGYGEARLSVADNGRGIWENFLGAFDRFRPFLIDLSHWFHWPVWLNWLFWLIPPHTSLFAT